MNYLAHALLSPSDELVFAGNFSGDFVKGTQNPGLNEKIWLGVKLHRSIDSWTDQHELVLKCKRLFSRERRRFAGIILDMAFDYLLSNNWDRFCDTPRRDFIKNCYRILKVHHRELPSAFLPVKKYLVTFNWLDSYHSIRGLEGSLEGIGRRFQKRTGRVNPLHNSIQEISDNRQALEKLFLEFFPRLQEEVKRWLSAGPE